MISPYAFESRIVLETVRDGDELLAADLLQRLMAEHDLAGRRLEAGPRLDETYTGREPH